MTPGVKEMTDLDMWYAWLARRSPRIRERLVRYYPQGSHPGEVLRGWNPHKRSFNPMHGCMSVRRFIKMFGREAYYGLSRSDIFRDSQPTTAPRLKTSLRGSPGKSQIGKRSTHRTVMILAYAAISIYSVCLCRRNIAGYFQISRSGRPAHAASVHSGS
jgi:hypothetical protein